MEYKDYYKILGVGRSADDREIKKAYRKLVQQYHPDKNPDNKAAEEKMKDINEAHEVLSDPEKRKLYDQFGADWSRWQQSGRNPDDFWQQYGGGRSGQGMGGFGGAGTLQDLIEQMMGGGMRGGSMGGNPFGDLFGGGMYGGGRRSAARGQDYEYPIEITLTEAYTGTKRVLNVDGSRFEVTIPAGAATGTRVRVSGKGAPGRGGGPAGDLYLPITVRDDSRYKRNGDDLDIMVPVDLFTALLGGEVQVTLPDGSGVMLTVPKATQNGSRFRIRGKGMPVLGKKDLRGNGYAQMDVRLPERLTAKQRALVEQLRDMMK